MKKTPIVIEGQSLGTTYIVFDVTQNVEIINSNKNTTFILIAFEIILSILVSYFIGRYIASSLEELSSIAKKLSDDETTTIPLKKESHNEIGLLYNTMHLMQQRIAQRNNELKKVLNNLEDRIEERTSDLQKEIITRRDAQIKLKLLINSIKEGVFGIDKFGKITFINPAASEVLGIEESDCLQESALEIFKLIDKSGTIIPHTNNKINTVLQKYTSEYSNKESIKLKNGHTIMIEYHIQPMKINGDFTGAVINFSDITKQRENEEIMWKDANFDTLTGIPNRLYLLDRIKDTISQSKRNNNNFSILYIDLNDFKPVNDNFGHIAGDYVLKETSKRLSNFIRETDFVARIGGDEFVVLLNNTNSQYLQEVTKKINHIICEPINFKGSTIKIGAAIGSSTFPDNGDTADTLISYADQNMYKVKSTKDL